MITERTCLILGAGASAPYGLPTANQLKSLILSSKLNDDETATKFPVTGGEHLDWQRPHNVSRRWANEWTIFFSKVTGAAGLHAQLSDFRDNFFGSDSSIDWFLRHRPEFRDIARLHLAAALLMCEQDAKLHGNWYRALLRRLIPTNPESLEDKLSVITFNYDRSFEYFFLRGLTSLGVTSERAADIFSRVRLDHVYGQLGSLDEVPYGAHARAQEASLGVDLSRDTADENIKARIRPLIQNCIYVNFIGFGFDVDNMKLFVSRDLQIKPRVLSTSRGLSLATRRAISSEFNVQFGPDTEEIDAEGLFTRYDDPFGPKWEIERSNDDQGGDSAPEGADVGY